MENIFYQIIGALQRQKKKKIIEKYGLKGDERYPGFFIPLLENISEICADGFMMLDRDYAEVVIRYRAIIILMLEFFGDITQNDRKDTKYSHAKLKRLLETTEIFQAKTP
ncbi:hypothetical protein F4055_13115 [Candidatus Poribacteria bacterium]|nr:hypothetical protein [Candidatus Poribacteria bacterium]